MRKPKAAVFASGTGSNFEALIEAENLASDIVLLICDQPDAKVIEKAEQSHIPSFVFRAKGYPSKEAYERDIVERLQEHEVEWIFLAGYMRIVGKTLLGTYEGKMINIHPSLLPAFPGKDAVGQALEASVHETGVTIHYVDEGIDTGPIIAQQAVPVYGDDTMETLQSRIQKIEHQLYPKTVNALIEKGK